MSTRRLAAASPRFGRCDPDGSIQLVDLATGSPGGPPERHQESFDAHSFGKQLAAHVLAQHWLGPELAPEGANRWLIVGWYDDEAVRIPAGWRLRRVRPTVTYQENGHLFPIALGEGQRISQPRSQSDT